MTEEKNEDHASTEDVEVDIIEDSSDYDDSLRRQREYADVNAAKSAVWDSERTFVMPGERRCTTCGDVFPEDEDNFRLTGKYLSRVCRSCLGEPRPVEPPAPKRRRKRPKREKGGYSHSPEKAKIYNETYRSKQIARWHAENGEATPPCECGCGEPVGFDHLGRLNRFAGVNHHLSTVDLSGAMTSWHQQRRENSDAIPIDKFREAVHKVKADKGFTWEAMAKAGGWSRGQLSYYTYDKRVKSIGRQIGEDFFNRIAGLPVEPSTHMKRKIEDDNKRIRSAERQIDETFNLTDEPEERRRIREKDRARRARVMAEYAEEYIAEHGALPLCACGCGEQVGMSGPGKFNKYAKNWHVRLIREESEVQAELDPAS